MSGALAVAAQAFFGHCLAALVVGQLHGVGQGHAGVTEDAAILAADLAGLGKHARVGPAPAGVVADHRNEAATEVAQAVAVVFGHVAVPATFLLPGAAKLRTDASESH